MTSIADTIKYYDDKRKPVVIAFFVLPLLTGLFVVCAGLVHKPFVLRVNYIFFFFVLFWMWILFAIHLPLAVLTGDSCDYVGDFEVNVPDRIGSDAGKVVESCLLNTSLLDALNLTQELEFRDKIPFYDLPNISDVFNFPDLDKLTSDVNNLTISSTFDFGGSSVTEELIIINAITSGLGDPTVYNRTNVVNLNSTTADLLITANLTFHKFEALLLIDAEDAMNQKLDAIKGNMSRINQQVADLKNQTSFILDNVNALKNILNPLFGYVDILKSLATCGFLGNAYLNFKRAYCEGVVTALSCMAMATFFIAFFGVPLIILSIVLKKRMPSPFAADPFSPSKSKGGRFSGGDANDVPMQQTTNGAYGTTA